MKKTALFALVWLGLACAGYGLALRRYGEQLQAALKPGTAPLTAGELRSYEGKLGFVTIGFPRSAGVKIRLEGVDTLFLLPAKLLTDERAWRDLIQLGVPGAKVSLRADPEGAVVRELRINPGTVYQKEIVSLAHGLGAAPGNEGIAIRSTGLFWILFSGLLFAAAAALTRRGMEWIRTAQARLPRVRA